jgi:hypothetical protein
MYYRLWREDGSVVYNCCWSSPAQSFSGPSPARLWPYFTVSVSRLSQPGGPGPRIYIPQEQGGTYVPPDTGFPFRRLLRLAALRWRYSTPPPRGVLPSPCSESKSHCDWRSVSQSVSLGVETHLGLMTRYLLLSDSYGLVFVGRPLWREDWSVFCICCWPLPAQSFSGPSPLGLATVFYCLRFETSPFVVSYDSQSLGGGIRPRHHMGFPRAVVLPTSIRSWHGPRTKHCFQQLLYCCMWIRCRRNMCLRRRYAVTAEHIRSLRICCPAAGVVSLFVSRSSPSSRPLRATIWQSRRKRRYSNVWCNWCYLSVAYPLQRFSSEIQW